MGKKKLSTSIAVETALLILFLAAPAWYFRHEIWHLAQSREAVQVWVSRWGRWGPLAMISLNATQIVVAPVPGYLVQVMAGYLFGFPWGGVYALMGMLLGGTVTMMLTRTLGRPYVTLMVGEKRIARLEGKVHAESWVLWIVLFLGPVGDTPFFLAGLTHVPVWRVLLVALFTRGPFVFIEAAVGAGLMEVSIPLAAGLTTAIVFLAIAACLNQERIEQVSDRMRAWMVRRFHLEHENV